MSEENNQSDVRARLAAAEEKKEARASKLIEEKEINDAEYAELVELLAATGLKPTIDFVVLDAGVYEHGEYQGRYGAPVALRRLNSNVPWDKFVKSKTTPADMRDLVKPHIEQAALDIEQDAKANHDEFKVMIANHPALLVKACNKIADLYGAGNNDRSAK